MIRIVELLTEIFKAFNNLVEFFKHSKSDISKTRKNSVFIKEENKSVECLDFLKSVEKNNDDVIPYELYNEYTVKGKDLFCKRNIYCKSAINNFSSFEFYVVSSSWNDFNKSKYYCLDLNTPKYYKIEPQLESYNGFAKRLSFSLNQSVNKHDDIKVQLNYMHKGCFSDKRCYIIADTKYKKLNLNKYTIIIHFENRNIDNMRIYLVENNKNSYTFLERIFPINAENNFYQHNYTTFIHYVDIKLIRNNVSLVYFFDQ